MNKLFGRQKRFVIRHYLYVSVELVANHDAIVGVDIQIITSGEKNSWIRLLIATITRHQNTIKKWIVVHVQSEFVNFLPLRIRRSICNYCQQVILSQLTQHLKNLCWWFQVVIAVFQPLFVNCKRHMLQLCG